ncbi:MAG: outer membrane beta-barrel protein [Parabacteroides merdae]
MVAQRGEPFTDGSLQLQIRQTHELRINYRGRTSQPSMTQLQPVADISDPLNTTMGNPDLKPTYTNDLFIRFQKFVPDKQTALMVNGVEFRLCDQRYRQQVRLCRQYR